MTFEPDPPGTRDPVDPGSALDAALAEIAALRKDNARLYGDLEHLRSEPEIADYHYWVTVDSGADGLAVRDLRSVKALHDQLVDAETRVARLQQLVDLRIPSQWRAEFERLEEERDTARAHAQAAHDGVWMWNADDDNQLDTLCDGALVNISAGDLRAIRDGGPPRRWTWDDVPAPTATHDLWCIVGLRWGRVVAHLNQSWPGKPHHTITVAVNGPGGSDGRDTFYRGFPTRDAAVAAIPALLQGVPEMVALRQAEERTR